MEVLKASEVIWGAVELRVIADWDWNCQRSCTPNVSLSGAVSPDHFSVLCVRALACSSDQGQAGEGLPYPPCWH